MQNCSESQADHMPKIGSAEILESISDAFYAVDRDWRFTYLNRKAEEWWRRSRASLIGKVYWDEFPQAVGSEPYKAHLTAAEKREVVRLEALSPILGHWVDISIYPTADGGLSVYFRDITEKKRSEELLRQSEARYRTLFDAIDAGFCVVEVLFDGERPVDYRFLETNPAFEAQTGLRNAVGRTARELVPDLEEHWFETYGRVARTGEAERFEKGSVPMNRWFDVHALRIGAPEERRVAILFNDISERRRSELALVESEQRFRLMADAVPQIIWITDGDGRTEFFNKQWSAYTGMPYEPSTAAQVAANHVHPEDGAATMVAFETARVTGKPFAVEHRIRRNCSVVRSLHRHPRPALGRGATARVERHAGAARRRAYRRAEHVCDHFRDDGRDGHGVRPQL
jgi:PAS domain S-box-containing protein